MNSYVICDLDGTLCDESHRKHLVQERNPPQWEEYFSLCGNDTAYTSIAVLIWMLQTHPYSGVEVVFITGRPESCREDTERWLQENLLPSWNLLMRDAHHPEDCHEFKVSKLLSHFPDATPERVLFVLEDRTPVVEVWRQHGYKTFQVEKNDW